MGTIDEDRRKLALELAIQVGGTDFSNVVDIAARIEEYLKSGVGEKAKGEDPKKEPTEAGPEKDHSGRAKTLPEDFWDKIREQQKRNPYTPPFPPYRPYYPNPNLPWQVWNDTANSVSQWFRVDPNGVTINGVNLRDLFNGAEGEKKEGDEDGSNR